MTKLNRRQAIVATTLGVLVSSDIALNAGEVPTPADEPYCPRRFRTWDEYSQWFSTETKYRDRDVSVLNIDKAVRSIDIYRYQYEGKYRCQVHAWPLPLKPNPARPGGWNWDLGGVSGWSKLGSLCDAFSIMFNAYRKERHTYGRDFYADHLADRPFWRMPGSEFFYQTDRLGPHFMFRRDGSPYFCKGNS